ncbi:MAG TPA: amidohydrolase family protein [Candidatus Binataceae bacterium]|nr:amidohydrolase family protein [Candidatus Binataceae bacterium]
MSTNGGSEAAALRARLQHPVIDSDGHWVEFGPDVIDYLREVGGARAADGFKNRPYEGWHLTVPLSQRRERRLDQPIWWGVPTRNTRDRATAMLPRLLYERMGELGIDFAVLYPTAALRIPFIADQETRQATCRAFNRYSADRFHAYGERLAPVAAIPMYTPQEAIAELEYAVRTLGLKVAMMPSLLRRPIRAAARAGAEPNPYAVWLDMLALDSEHDYDPVWAKCLELGVAPTFHTVSKGVGTRASVSNAVYNHIGHFGAAGEAVCKALFLGGVTRRFPKLKFAFLEGGVGWACSLYSDLIGHWKKRNPAALAEVDPANLNRELLAQLFHRYGSEGLAAKLARWNPEGEAYSPRTADPEASLDDFAACAIERAEQIRDLFIPHFYFGCEADDPANAWAFSAKTNPYGARLNAIFGSDIGHFDVPEMTEVLPEAWELVEHGLIGEEDFRDFTFANPVRLWAGNNPDFFTGTAIERRAREVLSAT